MPCVKTLKCQQCNGVNGYWWWCLEVYSLIGVKTTGAFQLLTASTAVLKRQKQDSSTTQECRPYTQLYFSCIHAVGADGVSVFSAELVWFSRDRLIPHKSCFPHSHSWCISDEAQTTADGQPDGVQMGDEFGTAPLEQCTWYGLYDRVNKQMVG